MDTEEFRRLHALEESFWWFSGMREITSTLLDPYCAPTRARDVLDAGCGTGANLAWLERYAGGGSVVGIDVAADALSFCRSKGQTSIARASVTSLPFADSSFDLVTSFDVLVQLPGAAAGERATHEFFRVLRPGGIAFVRVAAYEGLRSSHDQALGTHRRYRLEELSDQLDRAGLRVLRATYGNALLLPLAIVWRLVLKPLGVAPRGSDVRPLPRALRWMNAPLEAALKSEARWLGLCRSLPIGLSAICVAQKPGAWSTTASC